MKYPKLILLLGFVGFFGCTFPQNATAQKPNVILIITDDQGYGDIGAHGNPQIKTPYLDRLYNESYRFTNFHVSPTSAPTRASVMTGRYANSTGVWHTVGGWSLLRENEKTLADMFTQAGYATGAFGKWHLGDNYPFNPEDRGFQHTVMHKAGGVQQTPDFWGNTYFDDTYYKNGKPTPFKGYCTDVFFKEAISFIKTSKDTPFFCYIAPNAPHGPYNVPQSYYNIYKEVPESILTDTQKRFYGMITNIDDNIGVLRETLEELKIADNTILIFMTDNGTAAGYKKSKGKPLGYNANMRGTKGSQYEGGHRVPFFVYWKNGALSEPKDITTLAAHIDILPTLADLCGIDLPNNHLKIDGESLVPFLNGDRKSDRILITDSQRAQVPKKWKQTAVMLHDWRLIDGKELYNLENDPSQKENIANKYPDKIAQMTSFYDAWWERISVNFDKEIHIKLGHPKANPVHLNAHDIHGDGPFAWNQIYIRNGVYSNGYWSIDVVSPGTYEIALRRYPIEANLGINSSTAGVTTQALIGLEKDIPKGKSMHYTQASITVDGQINIQKEVQKNDKEVLFSVNLKKGKTKLFATFLNDKGEANTAYYVYINKL